MNASTSLSDDYIGSLPLQTQPLIRSCPTRAENLIRRRDIYPDTPVERSSLYSFYLRPPVANVCQHSFVTRMPILPSFTWMPVQ
jgi:hypothetical protein